MPTLRYFSQRQWKQVCVILSLRVSLANEAIYEHNKPKCKFANLLFKVVDCHDGFVVSQ